MDKQLEKPFTILSGDHLTLGSQWDGEGVNFALFSAHAERVELCLFDPSGKHEISRLELPEMTHDVWHGYIPGLEPDVLYGYRVHGPYNPQAGHRFNAHKLLIDPYAKKLSGPFIWHPSQYGFVKNNEHADLSFDTQDNAPFMPKSMVTTPLPELNNPPAKPAVPWSKTTIYELHAKGFTLLNQEISEEERGTFAGLSAPQALEYLKALGVSSIELLPIHAHIQEAFLEEKQLRNYWGYNSLSFFAPHSGYMKGTHIAEFRRMVDRIHDAGIEVILDVVYNHTSEGNHLGATHSFRGIDNASYYRLQAEQPRYYVNDTGCGNTLNLNHPRVLQMVTDSLRYWSRDMAVDGFRFDLAPVMGREPNGYNPRSAFMQAIAQDPELSRCKMIAEPWDIGPGGYQLGHFPAGWSEWNDDYRDTVRRFWRRDAGSLPTLARRIHGSSDIFEHAGRRPYASINYVTSHDGFTLADLVTYKERHNEANGENNQDGHRSNLSENFGVEGSTDNEYIIAARRKQQRNILATLLVSQGVPMILAGDEMNRTQKGNNNAYCQDNEINWVNWQLDDEAKQLQSFVTRMLKIRDTYPMLAYPDYIHPTDDISQPSIIWLNSSGEKMREEHWQEHRNFVLGYQLISPCKSPVKSDISDTPGSNDTSAESLLVIFNNSLDVETFSLPSNASAENNSQWYLILDTRYEDGIPKPNTDIDKDDSTDRVETTSNHQLELEPRSMMILSTLNEDI